MLELETKVNMKITAKVFLFAPSDQIQYGGSNPALSEKEVTIQITPEILEALLKDSHVLVSEIGCLVVESYKAAINTIVLRGHLPNKNTIKKIRELEHDGWSFNKSACKGIYGLVW